MKFCEYMAWQRAARAMLDSWVWLRFQCEYICLEQDFFQGTNFKKHLAVPESAKRVAATTTTTDSSVTQVDSKILRSACQHAVVASWVVTSNLGYKRQIAIMTGAGAPLAAWQGAAAQQLRDHDRSSAWLITQFSSGFSDHLLGIVGFLEDPESLRLAGFFEYQGLGGNDALQSSVVDDDYAGLAGNLALSLVGCRCRRLAYVWCGWPGETFRLLLNEGAAVQTATEFQKDCPQPSANRPRTIERPCSGVLLYPSGSDLCDL